MDKCPAWREGNQGFEPFSYDRCYATKEMETCECLGNEAFCDFYPEKRKAATKPKYGKWISVKDRLPEEKIAVLGFGVRSKTYLEHDPFPATHIVYSRGEDKGWFTFLNREYVDVTHWMPLSEPPKEE